ncbi:Zn-dependent hydrolase [Candidatus Gracilibacteria bacterium CG17_big_fil_post_rev_8_21_14_2_50_48_13]|nr:MAG: Zn-dependent hydrolase [Candidatus Gracilibacteria bacterium CG17_big_fil_post_rev_8_21_14_2_50_48_13]
MLHIIDFHAPRGCLSYLLYDSNTLEGILIDPSDELASEYQKTIDHRGITLTHILETHTHADHISHAWDIKATHGVPVAMSEFSPSKRKDIALRDMDTLPIGTHTLTVWHTPGHTNESLTFVLDGHAFTGDTLLLGGTGRTDFQAGSSRDLYASLERILSLPETIVIHPGHNYKGETQSTLAKEKAANPRLAMVVMGDRETFIATMDAHKPPLPELFSESLRHNSL